MKILSSLEVCRAECIYNMLSRPANKYTAWAANYGRGFDSLVLECFLSVLILIDIIPGYYPDGE